MRRSRRTFIAAAAIATAFCAAFAAAPRAVPAERPPTPFSVYMWAEIAGELENEVPAKALFGVGDHPLLTSRLVASGVSSDAFRRAAIAARSRARAIDDVDMETLRACFESVGIEVPIRTPLPLDIELESDVAEIARRLACRLPAASLPETTYEPLH